MCAVLYDQLYLSSLYYVFIEGLAESASHFRVSARRLERKMWWKNCRVCMVKCTLVYIMICIDEIRLGTVLYIPVLVWCLNSRYR